MEQWIIGSIPHGVPIEVFLVPASAHNWCNKGHVMCYPVCGKMHIKEPLLLIERVAHLAAARFLSHYLSGYLQYV